ncbi:MAG: ADP-ribose pyrophosphatase [Acidimicrobiales bacterium]|nr:ADP-ribose pyrophosphatase [Acidimicrobiales bacterium]
MTDAEPIPAATVIVARDGTDGLEVLMLRRSSRGAFGGMWVFPGGAVENEDVHPDDARADDHELAVARRAAVRETAEEAGLSIDAADLVTFSHWVPPPVAPKRFSTWFFLAPAPTAVEVAIDGAEIHEHGWLRPADAIAARDAGEIELAPPTWVTLWRLSAAQTVQDAVRVAQENEPQRFVTHMYFPDGVPVAVWHDDVAYEDGDLTQPGPRHRLAMLPDGWKYEVSA